MRANSLDISRAGIRTITLIFLLLVYVFGGQNLRAIWHPDEGRYTCVALNMLESGDWLIPRLNDEKLHFTKPPLTYWAIAASVGFFGRHEWAARFPNSIAFLGTILLIAAMGRRFCPRRPILPALIYATFPAAYIASNIITTDTLLTFWETLAVYGFVEWWYRREAVNRRRWLILMYAAFGLAFLTKGPPGLLPLPAMMTFVGLQNGWRGIRNIFSVAGFVVFAAIGSTWYILVIRSNPNLLNYFIGNEVYGRIVTGQHHRNAQWYGAFVVYIPTLLIGTLPWNVTFLFKNWRSQIKWPIFHTASLKANPDKLLLVLWLLIPIAVLFLARSRMPLYLLPFLAPISFLLARAFEKTNIDSMHARWLLIGWIVILASTRVAGVFIQNSKNSQSFASAIKTQIHPMPKEIVFVDSAPIYGLKFYTDAEVEKVNFKPNHGEETIHDEIASGELSIVYIVRRGDNSDFVNVRLPAGYKWAQVGGYRNSLFFAASKNDSKNLAQDGL